MHLFLYAHFATGLEAGTNTSLIPRLSINAGEEIEPGIKRTPKHYITRRSFSQIDVFTEGNLQGRPDLSLGGITPASQTATCTANHRSGL